MKHEVVVDLQKISDLNCGLGQFSWHLAQELYRLNQNIAFYTPVQAFHSVPNGSIKLAQRKVDRHLSLFRPHSRVWHSLHQEAPYMPRDRASKYILTIHDLNILLDEDKSALKKKIWLESVQKKVDRAQSLVFISEYAREFCRLHLDLGQKELHVIYNGVAIQEAVAPTPVKLPNEKPFLLAVATVLKKKNFHTLLPMLEKLPDLNFVLGGWKDNPYGKMIEEQIIQRGLQNRFFLIGKVDEGQKKWLYQNCRGLVFPSLQEGFGLPVVEAMHFGKPVFLSKLCALPEIGGEVAFYFDHFEADHMAKVVREGLSEFDSDLSLRPRLISRAEKFSWKAAAMSYLRLYQKLL